MHIYGEELKRLRKAHNLSQRELADKAGVAQGTISIYERMSHRRMNEIKNSRALKRVTEAITNCENEHRAPEKLPKPILIGQVTVEKSKLHSLFASRYFDRFMIGVMYVLGAVATLGFVYLVMALLVR